MSNGAVFTANGAKRKHVGVAGFVDRLDLTGKNGSAIELQHRIDEMTDDELKARAAELIANL